MPTTRLNWATTPNARRRRVLIRAFTLKRNSTMTGKQAAATLFSNVTRGGVIVFCYREDIPLPRTKRGQRYYQRRRRRT